MTMMKRLSQRLDDLSARVDRPSGASTPSHGYDGSSSVSTTDRVTAEQSSMIYRPTGGRSWADIPAEETLTDYTMPLVWDDELEDPSFPRLQVSESTAKAFKVAFGCPMPNQARLQVRKPFPFADMEATQCPKMDPVAKQLLQKEQKQADAALAKLQMLVVDAVAPLVHIVEEAAKGTLNGEKASEVAKAAISLLGNASAHISRERRKKVITSLNKRFHPLAEEEDIFEGAAPLLLGKTFEAKMKEHLESLKCLGVDTSTRPDRGQDFRRSRPFPPQGGGNNAQRGGRNYGNRRRFHPYQGKGRENFQRKNKPQ